MRAPKKIGRQLLTALEYDESLTSLWLSVSAAKAPRSLVRFGFAFGRRCCARFDADADADADADGGGELIFVGRDPRLWSHFRIGSSIAILAIAAGVALLRSKRLCIAYVDYSFVPGSFPVG